MVFGEVHFYSRLDIAFRGQTHRMLGEEEQEFIEFREETDDDENSWSEE